MLSKRGTIFGALFVIVLLLIFTALAFAQSNTIYLPLMQGNEQASNLEDTAQQGGEEDAAVEAQDDPDQPSATSHRPYFPYPKGVISPGFRAEIQRINREIEQIEQEALAEWAALPITPGTLKLQVETLGKLQLYDLTLSVNENLACTSCHMAEMGFTGPSSLLNATTVAYPGSVHWRWGRRKPNSYTYAPYYPPLQYNQTQQDFFGGNFWDLRATGDRLGNSSAEQAQGPPLDTQEMGNPDSACVVWKLSKGRYKDAFTTVWGTQVLDIQWPANIKQICRTPAGAAVLQGNPQPVQLSPVDRSRSNAAYDQFGQAIAAYEIGRGVSPFSSKFDYALANPDQQVLTPEEYAGWQLFRGQGTCNTCHLDGTANSLTPITPADAASVAPLFTDFTSGNLGLPKNTAIPFYYEDKPDRFGFTPNPAGFNFTDLGVGLFLRSLSGTNPNQAEWAPLAPQFDGKFQVSTVRNVDMRPSPDFVKAYMHNGYLKSLKEVVHFYNTRDTLPRCPPRTHPSQRVPGEAVTCWPAPEVTANMDTTVGSLGLSAEEEDQIVAFLMTLTDGYTPGH